MAGTRSLPDSNTSQPVDPTHEAWFCGEVEQAVAEADRPDAEWQSQDEVKSISQRKRAEWLRNSRAGEKATA